ncbi:GTP cyclohydrolase I [Streptomyces lavendulae]|uniref:GTP cyclohydrolase I n=1 Tax=Streptomyces lavendulae TaxID=1914 RepID=UPI0036D059D6
MNHDAPEGPAPAEPGGPARHAGGAGYNELVLERALPFRCLCTAHGLPFYGLTHIGYFPEDDKIAASCDILGLVEHLCRTPRTQQSLTRELAHAVSDLLHPTGAGVLIRAEHSCMPLGGPVVITQTWLGTLREAMSARREFLRLVYVRQNLGMACPSPNDEDDGS